MQLITNDTKSNLWHCTLTPKHFPPSPSYYKEHYHQNIGHWVQPTTKDSKTKTFATNSKLLQSTLGQAFCKGHQDQNIAH